MSGNARVAGAWKSVVGAKVKVGGTWRTVSGGFVRVGGTWRQWLVAVITDSFNRANNASLGSTETGSKTWTNLRSTAWAIVSNQASNSGTATNYPIASISLGVSDTTTSVTVSQGCGPAVWITDANNWWASFHYTTSTQNCGGGAGAWGTSNPGSCTCGTVESRGPVADCNGAATAWSYSDPVTCACGTRQTQVAQAAGCFGGYTSVSCGDAGGSWNGSQCCFTEVLQYRCSASASSHTEYRCTDSVSGSTTNHKLRLVSMVSGSIATTDDVSLASAPAAIKITTLGDVITARAYSDSAMTTLLGTNTKSPTTPSKGTSTGIVKAPGGTAQGSTVDSFSSSM